MNSASPKRRKVITFFLAVFISFLLLTNIAVPRAMAQMAVIDPSNLATNIWQGVRWVYDKVAKQAIATAFKTSMKVFLGNIAYDTATYLASGGRGQKPMFITDGWGPYLNKAGDAALGSFLDEIGKNFGRFNICEPSSLTAKVTIHYSLFVAGSGFQSGYKPRCTLSEMSKNWKKWSEEMRTAPQKFVEQLGTSFSPEENDMGIYLTAHSSLLQAQEEAKLNAWIERNVNRGIKDVTAPITRSIKTPSLLLGEKFAKIDEKTGQVEMTYTGEIVDSFLGTFTNTLMAKWMDTLFKKGFNAAEETNSYVTAFNFASRYYSSNSIQQQFASLARVSFASSQENVIDQLGLPKMSSIQNALPGPFNEVADERFLAAVRDKLTLKEALDKGFIDGNKPVGYNHDGGQSNRDSGYSYRNLVIMRTQRIVPVGWELAAEYSHQFGEKKPVNFNYLTHCFEDPRNPDDPTKPADCREDTNGNGIRPEAESAALPNKDLNPYYHLVDPNWVLKAPETYCNRKGPGPEILSDELQCLEDNVPGTTNGGSSEILAGPNCTADTNPDFPARAVQRNDNYCADWQSCLVENDNGTCAAYGYCLKEKPIWRFQGEQCPAQYNTCENFSTSDNKQYAFLKNTLQSCNQNEAGCSWYSTKATLTSDDQLNWSKVDRLYLNEEAESCDGTSAGCTKLGVLMPGVNMVVNGDFSRSGKISANSLFPLGWNNVKLPLTDCVYTFDPVAQEMKILAENSPASSHCQLDTEGLIPIDSQFTYQLSFRVRSENSASFYAGLTYYGQDKRLCDMGHSMPCRTMYGQQMFSGAITATTTDYVTYIYQIGPEAPAYQLQNGARYVKVSFKGPAGLATPSDPKSIIIDNVQLVPIKSPVVQHNIENFSLDAQRYHGDYSLTDNYNSYLKVAPAYLNCENSSSSFCNNYAKMCTAQELGCDVYTPARGGNDVPAKILPTDLCPAECEGYESFLEMTTFFQEAEDQHATSTYVNFIPKTATQCTAAEVGCEEFTNIDRETAGGEGREYFTYLRQCVPPENPNIATYYTWEGSDTTGYQLKRWDVLRSNIDNGPCTNVEFGNENCSDDALEMHICSAADFRTNPDCRKFIDAEATEYYRWQQFLIKASGECHPYRRTATNQIYNADPGEGRSCAPAANQCREYKGNAGNNIRNVVNGTFENGTPGGFSNSQGNMSGLSVSTESVSQTGHSLKVIVTDDAVSHAVSNLAGNKQYKLNFWAKKAPLDASMTKMDPTHSADTSKGLFDRLKYSQLFGRSAQAQSAGVLNFVQPVITDDWRLYSLGPIEAGNETSAIMRLHIDGLTSSEGFFIDNVVLEEYESNLYLIKNSWVGKTPASCDQPYPGAQVGCSAYKNRQGTTHYLKSFDYVCPADKIGCEAFINTQNSSLSQGEQVYTSTCDENVGNIDGSNRCSIRGVYKCTVDPAENSCQYVNTVVPNDEIIYLVNDPAKACNKSEKGCQMVGQPSLDRNNDVFRGGDYEGYLNSYIKGFTSTHLINDPDAYGSQLCSDGGLFCRAFTGEVSGTGYYVDPFSLQAVDGETSTAKGRTCYYDRNAGRWKKTANDQPCSPEQFMLSADQDGYEGYAGLCEPGASSCTEYRDPEKPKMESLAECDASISPQTRGYCGDGSDETQVTVNGVSYCSKTISGINHNVCRWQGTGCSYTEDDWYCYGDGTDNDGFCEVPGTDKNACRIGVAGGCFYDMTCDSYYYKSSSVTTCDSGQVNRDEGCLLFNDTGKSGLSASSNLTANYQVPQTPTAGCSTDYASANNCDSNTSPIKVKKDRICEENLFCTSYINLPQESSDNSGSNSQSQAKSSKVCLSFGRCQKIDPSNPSSCLEFANDPESGEQTYDFRSDIDKIRNLSGFSKAGLVWNGSISTPLPENKIIRGYLPPENMSQTGTDLKLLNSDFETVPQGGIPNQIPDWDTDVNPDGNCQYNLDANESRNGRFSLWVRLISNPVNNYCAAQTNDSYRINRDNNYIFSFYARSQNETENMRAEIIFLNDAGDEVGTRGTVNDKPTNAWKYYSLALGPGQLAIPVSATTIKIKLSGPFASVPADPDMDLGAVWFDDIRFRTALKVSDNDVALKECRLYPTTDALACEFDKIKTYRGWYGYCLESDPNNPNACVQWYPVDSVKGDSFFSEAGITYDGPKPLYYCLQAGGNYMKGWNTAWPGGPGRSIIGYTVQSHINRQEDGGGDECNFDDETVFQPYQNFRFRGNRIDIHMADNRSALHSDYYNFTLDDIKKINVVVNAGGDCGGTIANLTNIDTSVTAPTTVSYNGHNYFKYLIHSDNIRTDTYRNCASFDDTSHSTFALGLFFNAEYDPANPNEYKRLRYYDVYWEDCNEENGGLGAELRFQLNETCPYLAQVVETGGAAKPWSTRYNYGWTPADGNAMGYEKDVSNNPFGSSLYNNASEIVDGYILPQPGVIPGVMNGNYSAAISVPANTYFGRQCLQGSTLGNNCVASVLSASSNRDCSTGPTDPNPGICMGLGKLCYNDSNMTKGDACIDVNDCPEAYNRCLDPQGLAATVPQAVQRLQNLFVKIFRVLKFNNVASEYQSCRAADNSSGLDCGISSLQLDAADLRGTAPQIQNIKINEATGDIVLNAPGQLVNLTFNTNVHNDQLPLEYLEVDWKDTPNASQSFTGAMRERPSEYSPHSISHLYICVPSSDRKRCLQCWNSTSNLLEDAENGICTFPGPSITVQDHWGWCPTGYPGDGIQCTAQANGRQYPGRIILRPSN